jgi:hypothetical protein
MAKIINSRLIETALINAFEKWSREDVNNKHWDAQFGDKKWEYDGVTIRKNTETVGPEDRDIYDLGKLYESGVESYKFQDTPDGATAEWHWDATNSAGKQYATYVHDGTKKMPGRAFTDDIAVASSFFLKQPGKDLMARVQLALDFLNAS